MEAKWRPVAENTSSFESLQGFKDSVVLVSTNLSPMTNSESKPFDKLRVNSTIIRCVPPKQNHPASLIQIPKSSERPSIVPHEVLNGLYVHKRALSSKKEKLFIPRLDKPDQTPPFSSLRSKQSEAFWPIALRSSLCEFLSLSPDHEASSYNSA